MDVKLKKMAILPCAKDVCQECATKHIPEAPHNKESLYYHVTFFNKHGRHPTWKDAMTHCSEAVKKLWIEEFKKRKIKWE